MLTKNKYAFAGLGISKLGKVPGMSATELAGLAIEAALADAGVDRSQVDGFIYQPAFDQGPQGTTALIPTGIPARFAWQLQTGSTSGLSSVMIAMGAIEQGLCNTCIILYATSAASSRVKVGTGMDARSTLGAHGYFAPVSIAAAMAQRYRHKFGLTDEQLGTIAMTLRANANKRPEATMHDRPMTMDDYLASPFIVEPLRIFDCCLVNDGAVAMIITSAERARDLRKPPVYVRSIGLDHSQTCIGNGTNDLWNFDGFFIDRMRDAVLRAGDISLADIDVAMLYDAFSIFLLSNLEAYGFCPRGEGAAFIADGGIGPGGVIPCNTSGTALSWGYMQGFTQIAEGIVQMRGEGGATQVPGAKICLVTGLGGSLEPAMGTSFASCILGNSL